MSNIYDKKNFFDKYSKMSRSQNGLESSGEWHVLRELIPNLKNKKVLDLGCGYGWHSMYSIKMGASQVVAIDASSKMIEAARMRNNHPNIEYLVLDLNNYLYPEDTFDFVISNLVLHYIKDINSIFHNVFKTLKNDGIFLFNIEHPIFTSGVNEQFTKDQNQNIIWPVDNYYYPSERKTIFLEETIIKEHHTLSQILNGLIGAGFTIMSVEEPMPSLKMLEKSVFEAEMKRPMMLIVKAKK